MDKFFQRNYPFLISIGALPAAILRWQIDDILIVNTIGCFLLGFINALSIPKKYKLIFGFGFCGSLTTFSGWIYQLFQLINQGLYKLFFLNSLVILIMGFIAVVLGNLLAKKIIH